MKGYILLDAFVKVNIVVATLAVIGMSSSPSDQLFAPFFALAGVLWVAIPLYHEMDKFISKKEIIIKLQGGKK